MALFTFHILDGFWSDSSEVCDIAVKCFARSARVASSLCDSAVQAAMQLGYRIRRGFCTQQKSRDTRSRPQAKPVSEAKHWAWLGGRLLDFLRFGGFQRGHLPFMFIAPFGLKILYYVR